MLGLTPGLVFVKHQGKKYEVELDTTATGETFKYQLFSLTGVEPDRQKILVKGGQLKDDTDLSKLGAKPGQTFMMMGTPADSGPLIERPKEKIRFMEDMTEAEAAKVEGATPAGLQNLGNTCYMNATLQTLRAVPELEEQLARYSAASAGSSRGFDPTQFGLPASGDLTSSLRDLYKQMSETQEGFPPWAFLNSLRTTFPQFAEKAKNNNGYAQQDAEEAWTLLLSQLRSKLNVSPGTPAASAPSTDGSKPSVSFVDQFMAGRLSSSLALADGEAPANSEEPLLSDDSFLKLDCHIEGTTNHLRDGILSGLSEKIEKRSPSLERDALYLKTSRITRLPQNLTVHFVRFFWKREINKKAKIMRKVTFPMELDALEFCTEDLRKKLAPVRDKVREVRKDEEDVSRARKRQKMAQKQEQDRQADGLGAGTTTRQLAPSKEKSGKPANGTSEQPEAVYKTDAEYDAERAVALKTAKRELYGLIDPGLAEDAGSNRSGLYELRGVVTHQGASADSGHYTAYVKKRGAVDAQTGKRKEEDGKWWWFNDDKVTEVEPEKIETLSGGGELTLMLATIMPTDRTQGRAMLPSSCCTVPSISRPLKRFSDTTKADET